MEDADHGVLKFLGRQGKTPEQTAERFPGFDVQRLIRAGLVRRQQIWLQETHHPSESASPSFQWWIVLTPRGAEAIGIDPHTLHAA
jgi:hypothetical protein